MVQGAKSIEELLLSNLNVLDLYVTEKYLETMGSSSGIRDHNYHVIDQKELEKHSTYSANADGVAVVGTPKNVELKLEDDFVLILDSISDPGNLGTIIRIADWYGINKIICSKSCVDWYSPKVINSTMGSFCRVQGYYVDLDEYMGQIKEENIIGAVLDGANLHAEKLPSSAYVVIGSESHGISDHLLKYINRSVMIPKFGKAESLNAGVATAIICDNLLRQLSK